MAALRRPSPERRRRLAALAELHSEWVQERLAEDTPFHPRGDDSDYNLHHLDIEADGRQENEFSRRAREIFRLDPETGKRRPIG